MITMILGGLWHGAGAAYVLWGLFHGTLLAVHRWWTQRIAPIQKAAPVGATALSIVPRPFRIPRSLLVFVFFHITCIGWLLFRAGSINAQFSQVNLVESYLKAMFSFRAEAMHPICQAVFLLGAV